MSLAAMSKKKEPARDIWELDYSKFLEELKNTFAFDDTRQRAYGFIGKVKERREQFVRSEATYFALLSKWQKDQNSNRIIHIENKVAMHISEAVEKTEKEAAMSSP